MYIETNQDVATNNNPADIAAAVERRTKTSRARAVTPSQPTSAMPAPAHPIHGGAAEKAVQPNCAPPAVVDPDYVPLPDYVPSDAVTALVAQIQNDHKFRQGMIRAKNRIVLQGMACVRVAIHQPADYENDATKKALRERADKIYREAAANPDHEFHERIWPYLMAAEPLENAAAGAARGLDKLAKQLPVFPWVQSVKGLGTVSFATIVGEAGDIGTYRNPSCLWKRMGVAVIGGKAQGKPGAGATAEDWIAHGYRAPRRSVSWNARNGLILGMGKWRPMFGEDVDANPDLTPYQRLFAKRVRHEAIKCPHRRKDGTIILGEDGQPLRIKCSATGKESYSAHAIARAMRYVEKRMLKDLYLNWRRASA
ncbi:hypothetical protein [Ancylobacter polymorphus]|uniref:Uncharacterized protein n=1 Tax=Ancylobacter polymorphus TaxID=223390 RepID=A0A9E6ZZQ3_9HYPH|nr:hypothetical protein [Ancylobacter polymorphus]UOK71670.1 hypothetical protein K9D25_02805 [Ancylobacter polymorphus]